MPDPTPPVDTDRHADARAAIRRWENIRNNSAMGLSDAMQDADRLAWHVGQLLDLLAARDAELAGLTKANALLLAGMESQEELRTSEKQELRTAKAELAEVRAERDKAVGTLTGSGWTLACPAALWKPPVNVAMGELRQKYYDVEADRDALRRLNEWQPIETAPVNQSVLVFVPNWEHYGPGIYRAIQPNFGTLRAWQSTAWASGRDFPDDVRPTHWRPLPTPPA